MKSCRNCKNRFFESWSGFEPCYGWEHTETEKEEREMASCCNDYIEETEEDIEYRKGHYYTSSTCGDYSPSSPWNAPGMCISDFI